MVVEGTLADVDVVIRVLGLAVVVVGVGELEDRTDVVGLLVVTVETLDELLVVTVVGVGLVLDVAGVELDLGTLVVVGTLLVVDVVVLDEVTGVVVVLLGLVGRVGGGFEVVDMLLGGSDLEVTKVE